MDHTGFPRACLLDLRHIAGRPRHRKFNCRLVISQGRGVAYSPWLDGAFPDPARRRIHRLRKIFALSDYLQSTTNLDGEPNISSRGDWVESDPSNRELPFCLARTVMRTSVVIPAVAVLVRWQQRP